MNWRKAAILTSITLVILLTLALASPARAVEFTNDGIIEAGEIIDDDLFISAETVVVDGTVNGDLFINSSTATVNGVVNGNLIVNSAILTLNGSVNNSLVFAGQTAEINGLVSGTTYGVGSVIKIAEGGRVGRTLFFAGFSLEIAPGGQALRDIMFTGYQLLMHGSAARDVHASVSALEITGSVGRDVIAEVDAPDEDARAFFSLPFFDAPGRPPALSPGLHIPEGAQIGGRLSYKSTLNQDNAVQSQPLSGVAFELVEEEVLLTKEDSLSTQIGQWFLKRFQDLVTLFILGGLALWLTPKPLRITIDQARSAPLASIGWGLVATISGFLGTFLSAIVILIAGILVAVVSLGGLSRAVFGIGFSGLGLAMAVFLLILTYGSKLVIACLGGKLILGKLFPSSPEQRIHSLLLGVPLYVILSGIPLIGWLVSLLISLFGTGAIWLALRNWWQSRPKAPLPAAPLAGVEIS
ncbi:MAG: hypothetical protein AB1894_11850 [Chloroflexota bacterium]